MLLLMLTTQLVATIAGLKVYGIEGHDPLAVSAEVSVISSAKANGAREEAEG